MTEHDRPGERADDLRRNAPSLADPNKTRHDLAARSGHVAGGVDTPTGADSDEDAEGRGGP